MHNFISYYIYRLASKVRNPSLYSIYKELKSNENLSRDELQSIQFEKLKTLLTFAGKHSPYYKCIFDDVGFNPENLGGFSDIKNIPPSNKRILIEKNKAVHTDYPFKKIRKAITSGTSGESLSFMRSEQWDSANRAGVMRGYSWYDVKVSDKNGYFWGYNIDSSASTKIRVMDAMQNRFRLFQYTDKEIEKFCEKIKDATYLSGYSSMIYKVAQEVNKRGISFSNIKMVKGTSEMILPKYQEEVKKAFGLPMISEYGAAETGLIAFECPHGRHHINTDAVFVETNENDEILVTNLYSFSFPIIRYRLGDIVTLSDDTCSCGMKHPLLEDIVGRKGANIVGHLKEYPSFTFYYVFKNLALEDSVSLNYKSYQSHPGEVVIEIEGQENFQAEPLIKKHLETYFTSDVLFHIKFVEGFSSEKKKKQSFTSFIN